MALGMPWEKGLGNSKSQLALTPITPITQITLFTPKPQNPKTPKPHEVEFKFYDRMDIKLDILSLNLIDMNK